MSGQPWVPPVPPYLQATPPEERAAPVRPSVQSGAAAAYVGPFGACLAVSFGFPTYASVKRITVSGPVRCIARVYVGATPTADTLTSATRSGDLDENDCGANPIDVPEGARLWVLWAATSGAYTARVEAEVF
jgi:hypothetical protein